MKEVCENFFGEKIVELKPLSGGYIAKAYKGTLKSKKSFFVKTGQPREVFESEALGLKHLQKHVKTPTVLGVYGDSLFLSFEEKFPAKKMSYSLLGRELALMHKNSLKERIKPGFECDNTIGATKQINLNNDLSWPEFFWFKRLKPQLEWAEEKGYHFDAKSIMQLQDNVRTRLEEVTEDCTSLLHGDLWGGNHGFDPEGEPWLFDPACYYGHREADLAMMTLFQGFPIETFESYKLTFPLEEKFEKREKVYQLYHVLNHVNLFGGSYFEQAKRLMKLI